MSIYVDEPRPTSKLTWGKHGVSHMMTDGDLSELHEMADTVGLKREWFQDHPAHPHYDLSNKKRKLAIKHGAISVSSYDLIRRCGRIGNSSADQIMREAFRLIG
jgi:hypothetical protein